MYFVIIALVQKKGGFLSPELGIILGGPFCFRKGNEE